MPMIEVSVAVAVAALLLAAMAGACVGLLVCTFLVRVRAADDQAAARELEAVGSVRDRLHPSVAR